MSKFTDVWFRGITCPTKKKVRLDANDKDDGGEDDDNDNGNDNGDNQEDEK